jgi:hypothetical protein
VAFYRTGLVSPCSRMLWDSNALKYVLFGYYMNKL